MAVCFSKPARERELQQNYSIIIDIVILCNITTYVLSFLHYSVGYKHVMRGDYPRYG